MLLLLLLLLLLLCRASSHLSACPKASRSRLCTESCLCKAFTTRVLRRLERGWRGDVDRVC